MVDPNAWIVRRKIIIYSLIWLGMLITFVSLYALFKSRESSLQETIVIAAFTLFGSIVGSYVFGAIWDDKNKRSTPGVVETSTRVTTTAPVTAVSTSPVAVTVENAEPIEVQNVAPVKPEGP